MVKSLISITMPAYNAAKTISESINSVLAQTYPHWELIVVNDASQDDTGDIIASFAAAHPNIHQINNPTNQGVSNTRNIALSHATGKYVAVLDSDDFWHSKKLAKQVEFMQKNNAVISFTATSYINDAGEPSAYILRVPKCFGYRDLLRRNLMSHSSIMVRRAQMLPYPQGFLHEDYAVWLQVVKECGVAYGLDEPLLTYRVQAVSKSAKRIDSALMTYNAYRHVGYNPVAAFFLTVRYAFHSIAKRRKIKSA